MDAIFTVVSKPGPAECAVLDGLRDVAESRRRVCRSVALQSLESGARPGRAAVVLIHGRGHAGPVWAPLCAALAPERRVIAPDLPGFGHSGIATPRGGSMDDALACFADPIEALASEEGPVVLVGHSLGALVALEIALRGRAAVRALVLVAPMGLSGYVSPQARAYLRLGPERVSRVGRALGLRIGLTNAASAVGADAAAVLALRDELSARGGRDDTKRTFDALIPLFSASISRQDRLRELRVPVLLLWGERDEAFPLPIGMDAMTRLAHGEMEVLPTGHSPHLEQPTRVTERVLRFFAAHRDEIDAGLTPPVEAASGREGA